MLLVNELLFGIFVPEIIFTLFSSYFNSIDILRVWDNYFFYGFEFLILLNLLILFHFENSDLIFQNFEDIKNFSK